MDCNLVQGFLFDRPMPAAKFEQKLREKQYSIHPMVMECK
jgi:EAL domain-containing protein (putative c-di-GMP-specific phosphodiesterase class I)